VVLSEVYEAKFEINSLFLGTIRKTMELVWVLTRICCDRLNEMVRPSQAQTNRIVQTETETVASIPAIYLTSLVPGNYLRPVAPKEIQNFK